MSNYLIFVEDAEGLRVLNKGTRATLGKICFYPQWEKFVFKPKSPSVFNADCLLDIFWRIKFLNKETKSGTGLGSGQDQAERTQDG